MFARRCFRHLTLLLAGLSLLAACGFQLRGNSDLPAALARVYVTGADRELVGQLSAALAAQGAVVEQASGAARIDLDAGVERQVLTTDASGRATAYLFHYRVVFSVTGGDGAPLQAAETLSLARAFDYNPVHELQAEQEARFLETEMRREAVLRLQQRLARL